MFSGILRPARLANAKNALETYLQVLDGASDEERGAIVCSAHTARIRCELQATVPAALFLAPFSLPAEMARDFASALNKERLRAEKDQDVRFVSGLSVWVQSLSGVIFPELRVQGRQLWSMLARGFESAVAEAEELHHGSLSDGSALLLSELTIIPDGLEPRDATGKQLAVGISGSVAIAQRSSVLLRAKLARDAAERQREPAVKGLGNTPPVPSLEDRRKALEARLAAAMAKS